MAKSDLKPGDTIVGHFQNVKIDFIVTEIETAGGKVWLKHDAGEVHVRKQDIKDKSFELEVTRRT
jgi:hypothetical protein